MPFIFIFGSMHSQGTGAYSSHSSLCDFRKSSAVAELTKSVYNNFRDNELLSNWIWHCIFIIFFVCCWWWLSSQIERRCRNQSSWWRWATTTTKQRNNKHKQQCKQIDLIISFGARYLVVWMECCENRLHQINGTGPKMVINHLATVRLLCYLFLHYFLYIIIFIYFYVLFDFYFSHCYIIPCKVCVKGGHKINWDHYNFRYNFTRERTYTIMILIWTLSICASVLIYIFAVVQDEWKNTKASGKVIQQNKPTIRES